RACSISIATATRSSGCSAASSRSRSATRSPSVAPGAARSSRATCPTPGRAPAAKPADSWLSTPRPTPAATSRSSRIGPDHSTTGTAASCSSATTGKWSVPTHSEENAMATSTWSIDPVHSSVEFSIDYMGFTTYRTGFRSLEGSLQFDPAKPAASSVSVSIPVASVDVTNDRLMSRLMDPDLLGGKDHPTITFKSTRVEAPDPAQWKVAGDLTIHGVTKPVVLDTRYLGQAKHPFSGKISA